MAFNRTMDVDFILYPHKAGGERHGNSIINIRNGNIDCFIQNGKDGCFIISSSMRIARDFCFGGNRETCHCSLIFLFYSKTIIILSYIVEPDLRYLIVQMIDYPYLNEVKFERNSEQPV